MSLRRLLLGRVPYAAVLATALIVGTLIGGAAFEAANPTFDRIVWLEHDPADPTGAAAVRRALFADGRYLALTSDGYQAGILDPALTAEVFATVRSEATTWQASYGSAAALGQEVELVLDGSRPSTVAIANPDMNIAIPVALARVLRLLSSADRTVATVAFTPSSLRFTAESIGEPALGPADELALGFPIEEATKSGGVSIGGGDLAILRSQWTDLNDRFDPALNHRDVELDGLRWRITWQLDLEAVGPLTAEGTAP